MGFRYKMHESYRQYTTKYCELDRDTIDDIIADCGRDNRQDIIDAIRQACYESYDEDCYDTDYDDTDDYDSELPSNFNDSLNDYLDEILGEDYEEDGGDCEEEWYIGEL